MNQTLKAALVLALAIGLPGVAQRGAAAAAPLADASVSTLDVGRFGHVTVYRPTGRATSVVLFLSGDGGWNLGVVGMAKALVAQGAVVAGLDTQRYLAAIGHAGPGCVSLAADFESLSHRLQKELGLHDYLRPLLVGYSSGATIVYATLVQSPPGTFAGALSLGFCADQDMKGAALCPATGLAYTKNPRGDYVFAPSAHLRDPWIAFQGQKDEVCEPHAVDTFATTTAHAEVVRLPLVGHGFGVERNWMPQFIDAYRRLVREAEPPPPVAPEVSDLPLTEVPATAAAPADAGATSSSFALLLTGDGGWAGLDQDVSARLAAHGLPVVGFSTLRYFWKERTPDETTRDVARVLRHYLDTWKKSSVVLVGYSFGADVLPFVVNRLPEELRSRVTSLNLIGLSDSATFEVTVADWLPGAEAQGTPTAPEIGRLHGLPVTCIYGEGEADTPCPRLPGVHALKIGYGHHLSGRYDDIAEQILARH